MNVLHILDAVNRGGSEMLALDFCRALERYPLKVFLVVMQGGELDDDFRQTSAKYIKLQRKLPLDFKIILQLRKIIIENDIQIVHTHQPVEGLHAYFATSLLKVKKVQTIHGQFQDFKNKIIGKFLNPRMDANIIVSRGFLQEFCKGINLHKVENFHVVHNGIDSTKLKPTAMNLKQELGLHAEITLMGMVGNFNKFKDQLTICRALVTIFKAVPNSRFVFVGQRDDRPPYLYDQCVRYCEEQQIIDKVFFLGSREEIPDILNSLDLFVFSSLEDSFGLAVIEAMMMGIPVIAANIPPMIEVTEAGRFAYLFETGNELDLSDQIIALLKNKNDRQLLSQTAREWAVGQFSIDSYMQKLIEIYARLLGGARGTSA